MIQDSENQKLTKALLKKAMGYSVDEIVEEYAKNDDEKLILTKRKVTKKHIPPDIPAARALLELFWEGGEIEKISDEELEKEKQRLLEMLKIAEKTDKNSKKH